MMKSSILIPTPYSLLPTPLLSRNMSNVPIASQILQLIIKIIHGEIVNFPVNLGDFYSREEALAQQQLFNRELVEK